VILLQAANYQTVDFLLSDLGLIAKSKGNIPDAICYSMSDRDQQQLVLSPESGSN